MSLYKCEAYCLTKHTQKRHCNCTTYNEVEVIFMNGTEKGTVQKINLCHIHSEWLKQKNTLLICRNDEIIRIKPTPKTINNITFKYSKCH